MFFTTSNYRLLLNILMDKHYYHTGGMLFLEKKFGYIYL